MDCRSDGAARWHRTSLDVESRHRKMVHAHPRAGAWTTSCRREAARDGLCVAGFQRGCHRREDWPRAPRNLRFPAREKLARKSPTTATAAVARRSGDGGFWEENKVTVMIHDHRKSKLGFPFGSDTMRREKRANP